MGVGLAPRGTVGGGVSAVRGVSAVGGLLAILRLPHLGALLALRRDWSAQVRLHFLSAALRAGVLGALATPRSREELAATLDVRRADLLDALLELGVALGELARREGRYVLRGRRARALVTADGDPIAALLEEWVRYHGDVFLELPPRLGGAPLGDYLTRSGALIARSSRVLEPVLADFLRAIVRQARPRRMLDVGCGSGVYLRHAAETSAGLAGMGIDLDDGVARAARGNLSGWGLADRFEVIAGDIRGAPLGDASYDLVTLFNNVYYFEPAERPALFARLASLLAAGGTLAVATLVRHPGLDARELDLVLRSTRGCTALPDRAELAGQLRASGFSDVRVSVLTPGGSLVGLVARAP